MLLEISNSLCEVNLIDTNCDRSFEKYPDGGETDCLLGLFNDSAKFLQCYVCSELLSFFTIYVAVFYVITKSEV